MANLVTNIGKGRFVHYATLPLANDALIAVVLEASGLEADSALQDYTSLQALLAGPSNEQTVMGRKTLTGVTVSVNNSTDIATVNCDDLSWTLATGNPTGKLVICYDPDVTSGSDADVIPLTLHDFAMTPDGTDVVVQIDSTGLADSRNP